MKKVLKFLKRTGRAIYGATLQRFTYMNDLAAALKDCDSVLDIGCGPSSQLGSLDRRLYSVGIDAFAPNIEKSRQANIHNEARVMEALDIEKNFSPNSFDCVMAIEIIEHLSKEDGLKLLSMMESIARKKVIIFTPNGFVPQNAYGGNTWQIHKSGWTPKEMKKLGYRVTGSRGWKALRGELCDIKLRPHFLWNIISDITQLVTEFFPDQAYQIFCVKEKK
jgi:hypothetical protein